MIEKKEILKMLKEMDLDTTKEVKKIGRIW